MAKRLHILVVDDDRDNADSLKELFELEGHTVSVAYDGEAAVAAFRDNDYDIAFMDVMMPGRNGVESFLEIKRMKPGAKVFMMTGYSVDQLLQQAVDNGALGVLSKPVSPADCVQLLSGMQNAGIVLVAEDDPDLGPQLQEIIAMNGRTCELATDGKAALDRMTEGGVETLILDLNMPLMDGLEVFSRLRAANKAVPTIIMTGCRERHEPALSALDDVAVTGILNKPFDPAVLLERLERLAER